MRNAVSPEDKAKGRARASGCVTAGKKSPALLAPRFVTCQNTGISGASGEAAGLFQRGVAARRAAAEIAPAFLDHLLGVERLDMRMRGDDIVLLADREQLRLDVHH